MWKDSTGLWSAVPTEERSHAATCGHQEKCCTASSLRVLACSVRPLGERLVDTLNFFRKSLRSSLSGVDRTSITLATEEMLEPDRDCKAPSQLNIMRLLLVVLSLC